MEYRPIFKKCSRNKSMKNRHNPSGTQQYKYKEGETVFT
jgi:hypothetical protein